ncbi:enoyl-CoA hydratase/isomerase family protein [Bacillus carboniphilus]|uniref:Enoyl-CoA hydratase/isomerase family protein n=1 Tax=Bacillus carboniphilus TaxID=86663 RepID=A0ABY9K0P7_9BACI|nr:enoyl-CoA hydratase/isomerase family protein [Bacillus carboniphilus]WLR44265.1 enoyl-CoA hydratase/isomerase family protein [Bacillus carboniphilus]
MWQFSIDRPTRRNAINTKVMEDLNTAIQKMNHEKNVRAFIVAGTGGQAFCSGGDLGEFHRLYTEKEAYQMLSKMGGILYELLTLSCPTFALIDGAAVGGGCELAISCDFRIVSEGSRLGFIQRNLGITTGWGGATMLLEKLRYDQALQLLLPGSVISAEEAKEKGFATDVLPKEAFYDLAYAKVFSIVGESPQVSAAYKLLKISEWEEKKVKEKVFKEISACAKLWESDEHHQAVKQFISKNK